MAYKQAEYCIQDSESFEDFENEFLTELIILAKVPQHPNVNMVYGYNLEMNKEFNEMKARIFLEYSRFGDLKKNYIRIFKDMKDNKKKLQ